MEASLLLVPIHRIDQIGCFLRIFAFGEGRNFAEREFPKSKNASLIGSGWRFTYRYLLQKG